MPPESQVLTLESIDLTNGFYRFWWPGLHDYSTRSVKTIVKSFARRDGGVMIHKKLAPRKINFKGYVLGNDRWHTMRLVDELKRLIKSDQVEIGAQFPEGFRYWNAHLLGIITRTNPSSINRIPMTLPFIAPAGYGFSNIDQSLFTAKTAVSGDQTIPVMVSTNYQVQPVITITIKSVTPATPVNINISNSVLYSNLMINIPLAANDVLVINSFDETAVLNGNVVDSSGLFPFFTETAEDLVITTDATTISMDISATYRSLWL